MNRLSAGERIVMFASAALVILSFIPLWWSVDIEGPIGVGDISESGTVWNGYGFLVKLGVILAIVALALTIASMVGRDLSVPPFTYAALGAAATVLLVIGVLTGPEDGGLGALGAAAGIDISRGIALFVGAVLAAAVAVGGYMHMQNEGATTGYQGAATPPPPPA